MRVENGSKPENGSKCPNGISTQVTLTCDSSKSWNHQDISDYVSVAYHHDEGPCSVGFFFSISFLSWIISISTSSLRVI